MTGTKRRTLLTGARSPTALEIARHFHLEGHEVFAVDTRYYHVCRVSNVVEKSFMIPIPGRDPNLFIQSLLAIVEEEHIDLVIPIWEEVLHISKELDRFRNSCDVFCSPFEIMHKLHNKYLFQEELSRLKIVSPKTTLVRTLEDVEKVDIGGPYALKACYSRGSRAVFKVSQGKAPAIQIKANNPWIAQEWIDGERYCSYSICHEGIVRAHAAYPVQYTMPDKNSCVAFEAYHHPEILAWVQRFVDGVKYTGQIAFDFIERKDGQLFAIECNPRATSGVHLFQPDDRLSLAFTNETSVLIQAKPGYSKQIITGMVLYGWRLGFAEHRFWKYVKKTFTTKDVTFSWKDLKPFLLQPFIFLSYWITSRRKHSTIPKTFTDDFDWNNPG